MSDYLFRLEVPTDKRSFTVAEALEATSWTLHPDADSNGPAMILSISKVEHPPLRPDMAGWPTPLTDEDWLVLRGIWTGMPDPEFPMPLDQWQPYLDAVNVSPRRPDHWSVSALPRSATYQSELARAIAEHEHRECLKQAVASGDVVLRSPTNGRPCEPGWSGDDETWLLSRLQMKAFCDLLAIELVDSMRQVITSECPLEEVAAALPVDAGGAVTQEAATDRGRRVKPPQVFPAQEAEVLNVIRRLGHDPKRLPPRQTGKPWVKVAVWREIGVCPLFVSEGVFKKAWDRLRASGEIADRPGL